MVVLNTQNEMSNGTLDKPILTDFGSCHPSYEWADLSDNIY